MIGYAENFATNIWRGDLKK